MSTSCGNCSEIDTKIKRPINKFAVFGAAFAFWVAGFALIEIKPAFIINGFDVGGYLPLALLLASSLLAGLPVLKNALVNLLKGNPLDENFLMSAAAIGAFAIGEWEEGAGVMVFYMIGELIQDSAVDKSRSSIAALLALKPDTARIQRGDRWEEVPAESVAPGTLLLVRAGERIPLDGTVVDGAGFVDASMLSGESKPISVKKGGAVHSGAISLDGVLTVLAEKSAEESSAAKIIQLVEKAQAAKAKPERFITAFARYYTPAVVGAALLIALIPPFILHEAFAEWLRRALMLLVISCPCALVVSIPLGYFAGIGGLSRRGVLVKGAYCLDALAKIEYAAFDKTGTLTKGEFSVQKLEAAPGISENLLLETAVRAERHSNHPIAKAVMRFAEGKSVNNAEREEKISEKAGMGVELVGEDGTILAGNRKLMEEKLGKSVTEAIPADCSGSAGVYIAKDSAYYGRVLVGDAVKESSARAVAGLKKLGVKRTLLLTGDNGASALPIAEALGVDETHAGLMPEDKLSTIEKWTQFGKTLFAGDGINDAPVLARADIGVAMGSGADAALESADIVLMTDDPDRVPEAIARSRKIRSVIIQNVVFALAAKVFFITLAVSGGLANMWLAIFADVGVALIAIANAGRTLK